MVEQDNGKIVIMQYLVKIVITVALVLIISETAKRNQFLGAFLASLPTTTILALSWYYYETGSKEQTAELAKQILYLVVPSLAFFAFFPIMLKKDFSFAASLGASSALTAIFYLLFIRFSGLFR